MKSKITIIALACTGLLASCTGDHSVQNGKDTVKNRFGVAKDTSKIDTSKATGADNSGSGGTKITKDTSKKDTSKK
jgi:hypothetical protein